MNKKSEVKLLADDLHPRKFLSGWLRSFILGLIFGYIAYASEAGPYVTITTVAIVALLSFLALDRSKNKEWAKTVSAGLLLLGLAGVGWTVWRQRQLDAQYILKVEDITILRDGFFADYGSNQISGINAVLKIANEYDFPIYYRIERKYAKVGTESTPLDNPNAKVETLEVGHVIDVETNNVPAALESGRHHEAQVEFEILYGRTKNLEKSFRYIAKWDFFLCPQTGELCGYVTTTDKKITNTLNSDAS